MKENILKAVIEIGYLLSGHVEIKNFLAKWK